MKRNFYYQLLGMTGNQNIEFDTAQGIYKIRRLARKHHRLQEFDCNGVGYLNGQTYYNGNIDEWAKKEYGFNVKSAYVKDDVTVFSVESDKVESKIKALLPIGFKAEFQGDPRGWTVRLSYQGKDISALIQE